VLELLLFIETFLLTLLLTGVVLRFSLTRSLLDMPNDRSSHEVPRPRLGGAAIVVSFYAAMLTMRFAGVDLFPGPVSGRAVLAAAGLIALTGLFDDLRGLDARIKLAVQLIAAIAAVAGGAVLGSIVIPFAGSIDLGPLAVPVTVLWITGIINFYNFIDGIDGLAAGTGMIASVFLVALGHMAGSPALAGIYAAMAGSMSGFLRYNFPPARIFMGDCGSTFIGFLFAVLSIAGAGMGIPAFLTVLLLGGVLFDAALTLVRRALQGEKLFDAHRTHYYQRMTSLGLSHKQVTLLEYLVAVLLGASAIFLMEGGTLFVAGFSLIWTAFFVWAVMKIRSLEKGGEAGGRARTLAVVLADVLFIALSYAASYWIRLDFEFPAAETRAMMMSLPIVLVTRMAVFQYFGLYRAVWRYTTFDDIVRVVKAVALGSAVMVVVFTFLFRFEAFPRSVFIIDLLLLTVLMAGTRVVTRWFHELPSHEEIAGRRVVIGDTGRTAEVLLHHVRQARGLQPVGWLDDRKGMKGRMIHGLPVLGSIDEMESIAARCDIDEVIVPAVCMRRMTRQRVEQLDRYGVPVVFVSDPSDIPSGRDDGPESPWKGMRIAVAGSGPLALSASLAFRGASRLDILPPGTAPDGILADGIWPGVLEDRDAVIRLVELLEPDILVVDLEIPSPGVSNPAEAWVRTVLLPAERLASAASRAGVRMVFISRGGLSGDPLVRGGSRLAAGTVSGDGGGVGTALVIEGEELTAGSLAEALAGASSAAGSGEGPGGRALLPAGYAAGRLLELSRIIDGGEEREAARLLVEEGSGSGREEHERRIG